MESMVCLTWAGGLCRCVAGLGWQVIPSREGSLTSGGGGGSGSQESNATSCAICISEYTPEEEVRVLPCKHYFHNAVSGSPPQTGRQTDMQTDRPTVLCRPSWGLMDGCLLRDSLCMWRSVWMPG